jgi:cytosine/adenosine deaminase-related metal-dependent hydrolase
MTNMQRIVVEQALLGDSYEPSGPVEIIIVNGRIESIKPTGKPQSNRLLAMPALADAHNHARPLSSTSFGCGGKPLETWLPQLAAMPSVDAYTAAAVSFARSLAGGATSVMVHLTRPMGLVPLPEEARQIARAAHDVGVSIGFAVSMRDRNPLVYGDHLPLLSALDEKQRRVAEQTWLRPFPSVSEQLALVDSVADAVADIPGQVDVQYGPTGVQWCTDELLAAIADASAISGRRIHMHLLETAPQRSWADDVYPKGIISYLSEIGLLSSRLTLAHCVWADAAELKVISAAGCTIVVNPSSNLHLHSGIAPVPTMLDCGVDVAMGLDGCALDEDDDGLRELRLFNLLNHARGFGSEAMTLAKALRAACAAGRAGLGLETGGVLAPGMPADLLLLDLAALDRDALMDVDVRDFIFSRATKSHIVDAYSHGQLVIKNGLVTGIDVLSLETELRASMRAGLEEKKDVIETWPAIENIIAAHYRGCC